MLPLLPTLLTIYINCTNRVVPVDAAPIRSPQRVHSYLANQRFSGKDIVEIGTRNGDGMACFAQVAKSAVAIEFDKPYCDILRKRSAELSAPPEQNILQPEVMEWLDKNVPHHKPPRRQKLTGNFSVVCADYRTSGALDADIITWWEQPPGLRNVDALRHLRAELAAGRIRPTAEAVPLFDMGWDDDIKGLRHLITQSSWSKTIEFDEQALCLEQGRSRRRKDSSETCHRAKGYFVAMGIPLAREPMGRRARVYDGRP